MQAQRWGIVKGLAVTLAVFAVLVYGGVRLVAGVSVASEAAETELVKDAVHRAVMTCYAVEGAYPMSLEYLKRNYGLVYDEENYFVRYDAFASNVLPDIRVTQRGASE